MVVCQNFKINELVVADYNPRKDLKQGDKEYEKIKNSIEAFGYVDPIIVNSDKTIIGGHQRYKVLKDLGYKDIDCVVVELDKTKEKMLNIALNKISGDWDTELLEQLIESLKLEVDDLSLTGFDDSELATLMGNFNIDMDNFFEEQESSVKEPKQIKCPHCNMFFEV